MALGKHASLDFVEAQLVDDPLHPRSQLVVAVAGLFEDPQNRFDRRQQQFSRGELFECQRGVGARAQTTRDVYAEAGLDRAVVVRPGHRNDTGVIEHRLATIGLAS